MSNMVIPRNAEKGRAPPLYAFLIRLYDFLMTPTLAWMRDKS